ncbi:MAG: peptidase C39 [Methylomarinum sp.]|nr:peptidase C39 [Methylomarinum sp.]
MKGTIITVAFFLIVSLDVNAGGINFNGIVGGGNFYLPVTSFTERRFKTIYKQKYDFSCGSAALASLLTFHYDDRVDEQSVFLDMYQHGNENKIKKLGFSLLDMKRYLERRGYNSDGFKINLEQLITSNAPAITIINNKGYMHFIIIKAVNDDYVLIGDPALGVKVFSREEFTSMWGNRIVFLIKDNQSGKALFQDDRDWNLIVKAPLREAIDRSSLGLFNLLQPGNYDF